MSGFILVRANDKTPVGKLPAMVPDGKPYRVLRFIEPNAHKRPSGELVMQNTLTKELYRAAPPAVGLNLVPRP